jgi:hypothetical protein
MLLTACSTNDETKPTENRPAVAFIAKIADNGKANTRAAHIIDDVSALKAEGGFGVYGCYTSLHKYIDTDVNPDFMYNEHVMWNDTAGMWVYSPVKYWPNGEGLTEPSIVTGENPHYVSFLGYAPHRSQPDLCIYKFSKQHELGNPWLEYRLHPNIDDQVDLLYAEPILDQKKPAKDELLEFRFHHALACVGDQITIDCCESYIESILAKAFNVIAKIELVNVIIDYTLTEEGRLTLWNNRIEPNWQLITDGSPVAFRHLELVSEPYLLFQYDKLTDKETINVWTDRGHGVYYIPRQFQQHVQTITVTVTFDVTMDFTTTTYEYTKTLTLSDYPNSYQAGKHLYFDGHICGENAEEPVFEGLLIDGIDMAIDDWEPIDPVDPEVYNW